MALLFLAASLSIDAFVFGISFSIRGIKFPLHSVATMTAVAFLIVGGGAFLGNVIYILLPFGNCIGALLLIGMGMWLIGDYRGGTKEVMNHPEDIDRDNSHTIDIAEAIVLGFALSVDSVAVSIGYGAGGDFSLKLPFMVTIFQIIFLKLGIILAKKIKPKTSIDFITLISGIIILFIGFYKLTPIFSS